jgi:hypothetical protein
MEMRGWKEIELTKKIEEKDALFPKQVKEIKILKAVIFVLVLFLVSHGYFLWHNLKPEICMNLG